MHSVLARDAGPPMSYPFSPERQDSYLYDVPKQPPIPFRSADRLGGLGGLGGGFDGPVGCARTPPFYDVPARHHDDDPYAGYPLRDAGPAPPPRMPPPVAPAPGYAAAQRPGGCDPFGSVARRQAPPPPPPPEPQAVASTSASKTCSVRPPAGLITPDQYLVDKDGGRFCLLCNQWADEPHLGSKKHTKRAEMPEWYLYGDDWDWQEPVSAAQVQAPVSAPPPPHVPVAVPVAAPVRPSAPAAPAPAARPPMPSNKKCAYCSEPAIDREVPGQKSKYCMECWNWWIRSGEGPEVCSAPAQLPPMTKFAGSPAARGAPPPPPMSPEAGRFVHPTPPPVAPSQRPLHHEVPREQLWIQPDEIEV